MLSSRPARNFHKHQATMAVGHLAGAMQNNVVSPLWWFIQLIHVDSVFVVCLGIQNSFRVSDLTFHEQIHSSIIADLQS